MVTCRNPGDVPELLGENDFDAVLLDMNFGRGESSGQQGFDWLARILQIDPNMVVVMITAHGSVDTVVEAMKRGATDFVAKPWQNEKVVATLSAAVELHRSRLQTESLRGANKVLAEATATGTTCCCGGYFLEDAVARAVAEAGLRSVLAQGVIDFPAPGVPNPALNIAPRQGIRPTVEGSQPSDHPVHLLPCALHLRRRHPQGRQSSSR